MHSQSCTVVPMSSTVHLGKMLPKWQHALTTEGLNKTITP